MNRTHWEQRGTRDDRIFVGDFVFVWERNIRMAEGRCVIKDGE